MLLALGAILFPLGIAYLAFSSSRVVEASVSAEGLEISGGWFARTIPRTSLRLEEARIVTLGPEHELKPAKRQAGVSITHYLSGWYTLRNGEDALVFIHETNRVLYLPTYSGHSVLLGVGDPDRILEQLRSGVPAVP